MGTAVTDGKIPANPCVIRGAGSVKRAITIRPASLSELEKITTAMPEQYAAMILLASWCALRFGELTELRRKDIDLDEGVIRIRRAVVRAGGDFQVTTPKSAAGVRDVYVPPHLIPALRDHMAKHVAPGAIRCYSRPATAGISLRAPSTGGSTPPVTSPAGRTCASMTYAIPVPCWRRCRAPRWPN